MADSGEPNTIWTTPATSVPPLRVAVAGLVHGHALGFFTQNLLFNAVFKVFNGADGVGSITLNNAPAIPFGTSTTAVAVPVPAPTR